MQRKTDMLDKVDKSAKGSFDERVLDICKVINSSDNYYTTSSCSGKAVLIEEREGKFGDYYLWANHELLDFDDFLRVLRIVEKGEGDEFSDTAKMGVVEGRIRRREDGFVVKFKVDPPAIFVCARDINCARELLDLVKRCGFKQSGIVVTRKIVGVEIKSGERLELPIIKDKMLVDLEYVRILVDLANKKRILGWEKLECFLREIEKFVSG